jgi:hypothetical protein
MNRIKVNIETESNSSKKKSKTPWVYFLMGGLAIIAFNHQPSILSFLEYLCKLLN